MSIVVFLKKDATNDDISNVKNKINDIVSRLDLDGDEIDLNNYSWYEQEGTKKLALRK